MYSFVKMYSLIMLIETSIIKEYITLDKVMYSFVKMYSLIMLVETSIIKEYITLDKSQLITV